MKNTPALAAILLWSTVAHAITEPNGTVVPQSSGDIVQLGSFLSSRSAGPNAVTDAKTFPNTIQPGGAGFGGCNLRVTLDLKQSSSYRWLAWFNDTGMKPLANELHELVPPNSAVGATFTVDLAARSAYAGGAIGFALVDESNNAIFADTAFNTVCTSCSTPAPWVLALKYHPTGDTSGPYDPSRFYIAFEDGVPTATTFNNDGDFNDYVFEISGGTCEGASLPCDTGQPGICAAGKTTCTDPPGSVCAPLVTAGTETCDGVDNDCDGTVDNGNLCGSSFFVCHLGQCRQKCNQGGQCAPGEVCTANGTCGAAGCESSTCAPDEACRGGSCVDACDGIACPAGLVCRVGACVDPCAGVFCMDGKVCSGGVCVMPCSCASCGDGACHQPEGQCVEAACGTVTCNTGFVCVGGNCVDRCENVTCPAGQVCTLGACVTPAPDAGMPADAGTQLADGGGQPADGGGAGSSSSSGAGVSSSASASGASSAAAASSSSVASSNASTSSGGVSSSAGASSAATSSGGVATGSSSQLSVSSSSSSSGGGSDDGGCGCASGESGQQNAAPGLLLLVGAALVRGWATRRRRN